MQEVFDQAFSHLDFTKEPLSKGEYDACSFSHCDFHRADLSGFTFLDCQFHGCNLSLAKLTKTVFQNVRFKDCKLLGLQFEQCSDFGLTLYFENCVLNHASFYGTRVKGITFLNSQLHEVDFSNADLTGASFAGSDLRSAVFENSNLQKADFRTALQYSIDTERNQIKGAKFSLQGVSGLLDKYKIQIDP